MQLIFLDFDGVLNNYTRFPKAPEHWQWPFTWVEPELVGNLAALITRVPQAKIVISSTWRLSFDLIQFFDIFMEQNQPEVARAVMDLTPRSAEGHRGREIAQFLDRRGAEHYVILDDDSDMLDHQQPHFIHVDGYTGLTLKDVDRAVKILQGD